MVCRRYRPRQPRANPLWQLFRAHWPALSSAPRWASYGATVASFLRCGDLQAGFVRFQCPDCDHEFLLAFTCKQRGLCASCHQRRTLIESAFIADTVCAPVPHRHIVLTVPRLLRPLFFRNRSLLSELYLAAHSALTAWLRHRTQDSVGQPGLVIAVQTFGDFLLWHPHVHIIATAGVFNAAGTFQLAPPGGWEELRELWRHTLLRRLQAAGAITEWHVAQLQAWSHGGFSLDAGVAPLAAEDAAGRRRLAEYLLRAPYSLEKITYHAESGNVLYRSTRHWRTKRNFEVFSAPDFIATVLAQVPRKGIPLVRYYGHYSNKCRGRRAAAAIAAQISTNPPNTIRAPRHRRRRCTWRELIQQVWGADPLQCPLCAGQLQPLGVVKTKADIHAVLAPLGLSRSHGHPCTHGPPSDDASVLLDAGTGQAYLTAPPRCAQRLPYTQVQAESLRYRAAVMEPGDNFEQMGFTLPAAPEDPAEADGQRELFSDDYTQPDASDSEPIFWPEAPAPAHSGEDFIQTDALESV